MASIESYTTASVFMEANLWMNIWGAVLCCSHTAYYTPKQYEYVWWALIKRVDSNINKILNKIPSILNPEHIRAGKVLEQNSEKLYIVL